LVARDATFAALFKDPRSRMATAEDVVKAMDEVGVDISVVMGLGWTDFQIAQEANDYIIESIRRFPGKLFGFCSVNPAWGNRAVTEIDRCASHGISGVGELHADSQAFDIASAEMMDPIMQITKRFDMAVLVHASEPVGHIYPGKGFTTPDKLEIFIKNFPDNTIVCAHWGGGLPFYALMPEVARDQARVYFDTAASPLLYASTIFAAVTDMIGSEKILFGTDFPLLTHNRVLGQIEESSLNQQDRENILGGNAKRILGLS